MLLLFVYIWHFLQKFMTLCCGYMAVLVPTYFGFVFRSQRYLTQAVFLERRLCFFVPSLVVAFSNNLISLVFEIKNN